MAKKTRSKFKKRRPKMVSKKSSKRKVTNIPQVDMLKLKAAVLQKENNKLKREKLDLQRQLNEAQLQVIQLRSTVSTETLDKSDKKLQTEFDDQLKLLQKEYGIDLSKDKIDLTTGTITWGDDPVEPQPPTQPTAPDAEEEVSDYEDEDEEEEEDTEEDEEEEYEEDEDEDEEKAPKPERHG
jgi:hypothetical protein